ncbi:MAG: hypothetical protein KTR29_03975 [Rhodothermaceae bacterium]|nr:hypothetical protein [Rhodothermaceae bacterium]
MHPTNKESMLLTVQQEDPDSSDNDSVNSSDVSEDELDMILATMGTTSLKDSEMAILQNDASSEEPVEEITSVEEVDTPEELIAPLEASVPVVAEDTHKEPAAPEETSPTPEPATVEEPVAAEPPIVIEEPVPVEEKAAPVEVHVPSALEEPKPAPRMTARRVVQNFFKKLRRIK